MSREELVALRCCITLAELHIKSSPRGKNRLEWTKVLRKAHHIVRKLTHNWIDENKEKFQ